jgi:DNA invertase Pin-like site-specific DNA recombinase
MVAEMELGFIRDRQRAGIDAAKAKGIYIPIKVCKCGL